MPLVDIEYEYVFPEERAAVPCGEAGRLLNDAPRRVDRFMQARLDNPVPAFVPSDFAMVYDALHEVRRRRLATGDLFCEWGSGCGAVACLASILGFNAHGLEVDPDLVEISQQLAADFHLPTQFVQGSFVPEEQQYLADELGDVTWLETHVECGYEELGWEPQDFDLIFAYPWPGEEQVIYDLFEALASNGALLMTYHGLDEMRIRRKVSKRPRR